LGGEIQEMEDEENFYDEEPYKAHVHIFLAYHQVRTYRWWLSFHLTDLEHYREFEVRLEGVMFFAHCDISRLERYRTIVLLARLTKVR
jgi:hypothetical protein